MPPRRQVFAAGEYYHLYNRGVNRERIFFERENYLFFLRRLRQYLFDEQPISSPAGQRARASAPTKGRPSQKNVDQQLTSRAAASRRPVEVIAYCLMPNHYHLLVQLHCDDLSSRMQSLSQSYTNAINKARQRVGPLFQSRFQAKHVDEEEYLQHVSRCIHRNPDAAKLVTKPQDWEFSSYRDYIGERSTPAAQSSRGALPTFEPILKSFGTLEPYRAFVTQGDSELPEVMKHLAFEE